MMLGRHESIRRIFQILVPTFVFNLRTPTSLFKWSIGDDNDKNATKADEERPGEGVAVVTPMPCGRRKGSKNKPKAPPLPEKPKTLNTLENRVFEIPSGVDVRVILETFALKSKMGVFILSGSGTVAKVTLMHHAAPGGMESYAGPKFFPFHECSILSLELRE